MCSNVGEILQYRISGDHVGYFQLRSVVEMKRPVQQQCDANVPDRLLHVSIEVLHSVRFESMSVLGFELEWFDEVSGILQTLYLKFFLDDNTIEILKGTSTFLKRIFYPEVKLSDLFVGNSITVYVLFLQIACLYNCLMSSSSTFYN